MNTTAMSMSFSRPGIPVRPSSRFPVGPTSRVRNGMLFPSRVQPVVVGGSGSPTLALARTCAREARRAERVEGSGLLFLGACALTVLAGCAIRLEQCVAHWASFESFVRALVA